MLQGLVQITFPLVFISVLLFIKRFQNQPIQQQKIQLKQQKPRHVGLPKKISFIGKGQLKKKELPQIYLPPSKKRILQYVQKQATFNKQNMQIQEKLNNQRQSKKMVIRTNSRLLNQFYQQFGPDPFSQFCISKQQIIKQQINQKTPQKPKNRQQYSSNKKGKIFQKSDVQVFNSKPVGPILNLLQQQKKHHSNIQKQSLQNYDKNQQKLKYLETPKSLFKQTPAFKQTQKQEIHFNTNKSKQFNQIIESQSNFALNQQNKPKTILSQPKLLFNKQDKKLQDQLSGQIKQPQFNMFVQKQHQDFVFPSIATGLFAEQNKFNQTSSLFGNPLSKNPLLTGGKTGPSKHNNKKYNLSKRVN